LHRPEFSGARPPRNFDPQDQVRAAANREEIIRPGAHELLVPVSPSLTATLNEVERRRLMWYRLRYRITPATEWTNATMGPIAGYISLSELIAPDVFELRVAAPRLAREGTRYRARAFATHPLTSHPVAGVEVSGEVEFESGERKIVLKATGLTDRDGIAWLDFELPREMPADDGEIRVKARRGDFQQEAAEEISVNNQASILVTTDKTLYQPGQQLHVRALVFDAARRALANQSATLKIEDPEGITVFRATLQTSRFGVASVDWPISESTRLGNYMLSLELDEGQDGGSSSGQGYAVVRVSRYELPNYVVSVKTDRLYYLPGQSAEVEVRADYLFGQPVPRGHVRVVRENERTWNYREQKWDVEEGEQHKGAAIKDGRFTARLDFTDEFAELAKDDYARYRDLTYAAYFTDPTTNRTEQRRFDVRLTRDAIHVYVIEGDQRQSAKLPLQFYVSASYADGTPAAACDVQIRDGAEAAPEDETPGRVSAPVRQIIRANQYGVAKVSGLRLEEQEDESEAELYVTAADGKGAKGYRAESLSYTSRPVLRVETDRALYRPGAPVRVRVNASEPEMQVVVDAMARDGRVLHSEMLQLRGGRGSLVISDTGALKDELTITAYSLSENEYNSYHYPAAARTVLFPHDRALRLDVRMSRAAYRPGEDALADFSVRAPDGRAIESALGVVVFDKAVEARARTDSEFGGYGFGGVYHAWSGAGAGVGGVSRDALDRIDLARPLPAGFELAAEILLQRGAEQWPQIFGGYHFETDPSSVFKALVAAQLNPLTSLLEASYAQQQLYPTSAEMLHRLAFPAGVEMTELRDPWGTPYRTEFSVEREMDVQQIRSAGPDKQFATTDDFTVARLSRPYFRAAGEAINRAVARHHARTGHFIRDAATLKGELRREGLSFDTLRDPWGQAYQLIFGINGTRYTVAVRGSGPDKKLETVERHSSDDVHIWTTAIDYTRQLKAEIDDALGKNFAATKNFPQTVAGFDAALKRRALSREKLLRDPWGRPLYLTFRKDARFTDRVRIQTYAAYGHKPQERTEITPITQHVNYLDLRSAGMDGKEGTLDDFNLATFSRIVAEQSSKELEIVPVTAQSISFSGSTGAIIGTVLDSPGAVIPGAAVEARHNLTAMIFKAVSDDEGQFYLRNLPTGFYQVTLSAGGFKNTIITDVPVSPTQITQLDLILEVGGIAETVTVMSDSVTLETTASQLSAVSEAKIENLPIKGRNYSVVAKPGEASTPRLREYFPETLVWQPSIETDKEGRAQIRFKLADNMTTWKMSVIGSTEDGEIGMAEQEIHAFQPFFVEHDPPRILTEGDEISLPVVLRNYLDKPQQVALDIKPEDWFALTGPSHKQAHVPAGDAMRETFDFRAVSSVTEGRQRITAVAGDANDAIEKPITVHPDGAEIAHTAATILGDTATLDIDIPADAVPRTARAELKIYPNPLAHVVESVEAIMSRPYGCGEQTISSTYPSLLVLRHYQQLGLANDKLPPIAAKARRYVRLGYERLLSYRAADGGFSYWGRGEAADLALTAYAFRFLEDAREFVAVDEDVPDEARNWLIKQQQPGGSWAAHEWDQQTSKPRTAMLTAYVARVLARHERRQRQTATTAIVSTAAPAMSISPETKTAPPTATPLRRALDYLSQRLDQIDEPYFIASYALAAQDAGESPALLDKAIDRLTRFARTEADGTYWSLETNTPFYGWGQAGRIETTALVLQALTRVSGESQSSTPADARHPAPVTRHLLAERALLFLLRNKDRYGVWLSTQATINVLDALTILTTTPSRAGAPQSAVAARDGRETQKVEVFVNQRRAGVVQLPVDDQLNNPVPLDLSGFLSSGANRVEIKRPPGSTKAAAHVVSSYYLPWAKAQADGWHHAAPEAASALRLSVKFDQTTATVGDEISCTVFAERFGQQGYGMLLGEIGLPPGADVDRQSLEAALKASAWEFTRYDVLPDRLIVYLWPRAGGTKFNFKFRSRFGLRAQTAPSVLYDYYNPTARAVLAPTRFTVQEKVQATAMSSR